jgi:hypothetical protein
MSENARRCGICSLNWPDLKAYEECPQCGEPTRRLRSEEPSFDSDTDARSAALHMEFERYFEDWDKRRTDELAKAAQEGVTEEELREVLK